MKYNIEQQVSDLFYNKFQTAETIAKKLEVTTDYVNKVVSKIDDDFSGDTCDFMGDYYDY